MKRNLTKPIYKFLLVLLIAGFGGMSAYGQDLTLIKRVMNDNVDPGDIVTYQIIYINNSADRHTDVVVVDQVPAGDVEYIGSVPAGAIHNTTSNTVTFDKTVVSDFANLTTGSGVLYVSFRVGKLGSDFTGTNHYPTGYYLDSNIQHETLDATIQKVVNQASITSSTQTVPSYSNDATATALQFCEASVTQASPGALKSNTGNMYEYLVTITNTGNVYNKYDLTASIYDPTNNPYNDGSGLPEVTTLNTLNPSLRTVGSTPTNPTPVTTTPWLAPGEMFTFILHLDITNDAQPSLPDRRYRDALTSVKATSILCNKEFDKIFRTGVCGGNDCTPGVSVGAYKYGLPDIVESGGELEYTIVLFNGYTVKVGSNYVGQAVSGISIKDIFPMTYINSIISVGSPISENAGLTYTYNPSDHTWNFSNLPPGTTTIKVRVRLNTNIANNTIIENTLESYYNGSLVNTYIAKNTVISTPDLKIEKSSSQVNVEAGEEYTYTLHYENNGSYFSELTEIYDDFDEGLLEIIEVIDETGSTTTIPPGNLYDPVPAEKIYVKDGKIKWEVGMVEIGESGTVSYKVRVKTGNYPAGNTPINNTANIIDDATKRDKDLSDNIIYLIVNLTTLPDLELTKTVNTDKILSINTDDGETLTYTITINNIGEVDLPASAGGYTVTDVLPAGLSYVSNTSGIAPTIVNNTLTWNFHNAALVADGTPHSFNVVVKGVNFSQIGNILRNEASVALNGTLSESDYDNNSDFAETEVVRNLWVGSVDNKWEDEDNWTYFIPGDEDYSNLDYYKDVEFATLSNNITPTVNDLYLDKNRSIRNLINQTVASTDPAAEPKALVVTNNNTLIIEGTAQTLVNEHIRIQSKVGEGNGALVFTQPTQNPSVKATVEYDSKSQKVTDNVFQYEWQYIGTPVQGATPNAVFGPNVSGSKYGPLGNVLIRIYSEPKNDPSDIGDKWNDANLTIPMVPFKEAYEVVQPDAQLGKIYEFKGILNVGDFSTGNLGFTSGAYFRGNYILANSYAAPIRIDKLSADDFDNLEQTIYLFNTGSREQWIEESGWSTENGLSTLKGTYYAIPRLISDVLNVDQIPSLNGFLVRRLKNDAGYVSDSDIQFDFRYASLVKDLDNLNNTTTKPMYVQGVSKAPAKVAGESSGKYPLLKIDLVNGSKVDRVMLVTAPNATKKFDNGWDGYKLLASGETQIYTFPEGTDRFQVNTDSDLDGTILGVYNGSNGTEFKLDFHMQDMQGVYHTLNIEDLQTGTIKDITDGGSYTFTVNASSPEARFRINGIPVMGVPTSLDSPIEVIYHKNKDVIVINGSDEEGMLRIYDIAGKQVQQLPITTGQTSEKLKLRKGIYVFDVRTTSYRSTHKIIVQ